MQQLKFGFFYLLNASPTTKDSLRKTRGIIYVITNILNGMMYIGKSVNTFNIRYGIKWWNNLDSIYLENAVKKYGYMNFEIKFIEFGVSDDDILNKKETEYILKYNTLAPHGYNLESGGLKNKRFCQASKDRLSDSLAKRHNKTYTIRSPTEEIFTFYNMKKFAREHGIACSGLRGVLSKRLRQNKGWHLLGTDISVRRRNQMSCVLKDEIGNIYHVNNVRTFAREHGLSYVGLYEVISGEHKTIKGFRLASTETDWHPYIDSASRKYKKIILIKENKEYVVNNIYKFARDYNLNAATLRNLIFQCSKKKEYKGFALKEVIYKSNPIPPSF